MTAEIVKSSPKKLANVGIGAVPTFITNAGENASRRFVEFFTANIRNKNTRFAYAQAIRQFCDWCDEHGFEFKELQPLIIAGYIEQHPGSPPTVKQHLAAIRMLFDWMVIGQIVPMNPAASVRGPKHVVKVGKTPVLTADQARQLLDSIDTSTIAGLRDRALIGVMVYTFGRVSAVVGMKGEDYFQNGKRWWFRLREKGGKRHQVPANHNAEAYVDAYIEAAGIAGNKKEPLFRSLNKSRELGEHQMHRVDVYRMIIKRAKEAGLSVEVCCHTFRATGITAYLENGGTIENAQQIAAHESPRTTKLYDRTGDEITLDEVERILI